MVKTDSLNISCLSSLARRKGAQDDHVVQGVLNHIERLGRVKAELKCDQDSSTIELGNKMNEEMKIDANKAFDTKTAKHTHTRSCRIRRG